MLTPQDIGNVLVELIEEQISVAILVGEPVKYLSMSKKTLSEFTQIRKEQGEQQLTVFNFMGVPIQVEDTPMCEVDMDNIMKIALLIMCLILPITVWADCSKVYSVDIDGDSYTFTIGCDEEWNGNYQKIDDTYFVEIEGCDGIRLKRAERPQYMESDTPFKYWPPWNVEVSPCINTLVEG